MTWLACLFGVTRGELLGALGGVLGRIIGALGAALAVYLTLNRQRKDERQRSFNAIVREVIEFSRLAVGHLATYENIHSMAAQLPSNRLPAAMAMPRPTVYPGIASNIGRLARPQRIVAFFTRITEIESVAALIAQGPGAVNVLPEDIVHIARAWIDVCELGRSVINEQKPDSEFDAQVRATILSDLETALPRARAIFGEDSREPQT